MKKIIIILFLALTTLGCSKNEEVETDLNCLEITTKYSDIVKAKQMEYGINPSRENCLAYKKAVEEFIEKTKNCTTASENIKSALKNLNCN